MNVAQIKGDSNSNGERYFYLMSVIFKESEKPGLIETPECARCDQINQTQYQHIWPLLFSGIFCADFNEIKKLDPDACNIRVL